MLWSYLRYVVRRKSAFRIHSPFVYGLYTKVICGNQYEALDALGIEREVKVSLNDALNAYLSCGDDVTMFTVGDIHGSKENEREWDTICSHPDVILTIDLYHKGLIFNRKGMEKQNFVLKNKS